MIKVYFRNIILIALIFLAMPTMVFSQENKDSISKKENKIKAENSYIHAVQLLNMGYLEDASKTFNSLVKTYPDEDAYWYYDGLCKLYQKDVTGAADCFKEAARLDPKNYWYRDRLAYTYSAMGDDDLTISTYEKILEDFPKKTNVYYSLVNLYLHKGQYDKAVQAMTQIENNFGKSDIITTTEYDILMQQKKPEEALKLLKDYVEEYSSPQVLTMIGDHYISQDNDSLAIGYYDEALSLDSSFTPAILGKAESYRISRNYDSYFEILQKFMGQADVPAMSKNQYITAMMQHLDPFFIQKNRSRIDSLVDMNVAQYPTDSTTLNTAGLYYFRTERQDKAKELMRKNMVENPKSISATGTYLQLLSVLEDYDGMIAEGNEALNRFPNNSDLLQMINYAYYNKKDYKSIINNCKQIIKAYPSDTSLTLPAYSSMGDSYHELNDEKNAFKCYDTALKINPNYAPVLNNYAYYLSLKKKKLSKAAQMSKKTIDQEPDNPTYLDTYAWILHLQGKDSEAKTYFKHAMLYGGKESSVIMKHYAVVLEALGENDLAKVYRSQAEELEKQE